MTALSTVQSLANHAIPSNSACKEPATLKTHLELSFSGPISGIQHKESRPRWEARGTRLVIISFRTRVLYEKKRPHNSLGYRPPAPETKILYQQIPNPLNTA